MQLEQKNKMNMVAYLRSWNNYSASYLAALPDIQLYAIYLRIKQGREALINEILDLQKRSFPKKTSYTREGLEQLEKKDLLFIKENFGFSNEEKSFNGEEPFDAAPQETEALQTEDYELELLTDPELAKMYGESASEYSFEEFQEKGIYCLEGSNQILEDAQDELKDQLLTLLMEAHRRKLIYFPGSKKMLNQEYTLESLKLIYVSRVQHLQIKEFPAIEKITARLSLH